MMKKLTIAAALTLLLLPALARRQNRMADVFDVKPTPAAPAPKVRHTVERDDTVYAVNGESHFDWLLPGEPLDASVALRTEEVARFSNKNHSGFFTRVETLAGGKAASGQYTIDPKNFGSDIVTPELCRLEESVAASDLLSDASGKRVLQTRYYDVNGAFLGSYVSRYISPDVQKIYFFDALGRPMKTFNIESRSPFGVQTVNVLDSLGRVAVSYLVDGDRPVTAPSGLGQIRTTRSADGLTDTVRYYGAYGEPLVPVQGRNGYGYIVRRPAKGAVFAELTSLGADGCPAPAPDGADTDDYFRGVVTARFFRGEAGRIDSVVFYDEDGRPAVDLLGAHGIYNVYEGGHRILREARDLAGKPAAFTAAGVSRQKLSYDEEGRLVRATVLDTDGKLAYNEGFNSVTQLGYGADGTLCSELSVIVDSLGSTSTFRYKKDATGREWHYADGRVGRERYDSHGRLLENVAIEVSGDSSVSRYSYPAPGKCRVIDYSASGTVENDVLTDTLSRTKLFASYDSLGVLVQYSELFFNHDMDHVCGQYSLGVFGQRTRSGESGAVYYRVDARNGLDGESIVMKCTDEWGEPDYCFTGTDDLFVTKTTGHGVDICNDEDGLPIYYMGDALDDTPRFPVVEVVDSAAYALGLRDNDLILQYGDYSVPALMPYLPYTVDWAAAQIRHGASAKRVKLFRKDDALPYGFGAVELELPAGSTAELGFLTHPAFQTRRRMERIQQASGLEFTAPEAQADSVVAVLLNSPMLLNARGHGYLADVKSPAWLLGAYVEGATSLRWATGEPIDSLSRVFNMMENSDYPMNVVIDYTTDMQTSHRYIASPAAGPLPALAPYVADSVASRLAAIPRQAPEGPSLAVPDSLLAKLSFAKALYTSGYFAPADSIFKQLYRDGVVQASSFMIIDLLYRPAREPRVKEAERLAADALAKGSPTTVRILTDYLCEVDDAGRACRWYERVLDSGNPLRYNEALTLARHYAVDDSLRAARTLAKAVYAYDINGESVHADIREILTELDSYGPRYDAYKGDAVAYYVLRCGGKISGLQADARLLKQAFELRGSADVELPVARLKLAIFLYYAKTYEPAFAELYESFMAGKRYTMTPFNPKERPSAAYDAGLRGTWYVQEFNGWSADSGVPLNTAVESGTDKPSTVKLYRKGKTRTLTVDGKLGVRIGLE